MAFASTLWRMVLFSQISFENFGRIWECGNGDSLASSAIWLARCFLGRSSLFVCNGANPLCGWRLHLGPCLADSKVGCLSVMRGWAGFDSWQAAKIQGTCGSD